MRLVFRTGIVTFTILMICAYALLASYAYDMKEIKNTRYSQDISDLQMRKEELINTYLQLAQAKIELQAELQQANADKKAQESKIETTPRTVKQTVTTTQHRVISTTIPTPTRTVRTRAS